ncbi:nuclease HARBI1-like protein [Perilla frutescens var. hirtella]|uniref:Nuclease HARBI1-like protein n=1 Tax=Perilla frutescens var. hirtella TaxID=608512 RepID=A0AAD4P030_PERFH|nr:nuclease HARBI1-like protein [Perilla frutescens var. hirtella]
MEEEIDEEENMELYENVRLLMLAIKAVIVLLGKIVMMRPRIKRSLQRRPITRNGYHFVTNMIEGDPQSFQQLYKMYPDAFMKLCSIIREKTHLEDTRYICVEEMVATFLIIVGHNDRYCNVRQRFDHLDFATSQNFNKTLKALNTIALNMMVKPSTGIPAKIQESTRFNHFFKDCIGAIDGTHIPTMVPDREVSSFRNRHGMQSHNILVACNFDLQFMYVLSGWEGKYFLVDCGFANRRQFLASLCGDRYHLKDFGGQGRHPRNVSELFNLRHASLRNVIERIFGVFKSRFTTFKTAPPFPFQTQAELVLACAGFHNFLRKECRSDEFPAEYEGDQDLPPLDTEEENLEWLFQSQLQQRTEANT